MLWSLHTTTYYCYGVHGVYLAFATQDGEGFNCKRLVYDPFTNRNVSWTWWLETYQGYFVALENEWNYDRLAGLVA